ncbi:MAG: hypothetical protein ACJAUD_002131 [Crocinitomicaceae bacterium]|jgi:hypothetical protein
MKYFIIFAIVFITNTSNAQGPVIPLGSISLQMGVYDRGLIGVGFDLNGRHDGMGYFNANASVGLGIYVSDGGWIFDVDPSIYLTLSPSYNFGKKNSFFTIGFDGKRLQAEGQEVGYGAGGFMGGTFNFNGGFVFKVRAGVTRWYELGSDGPGFDILYSRTSPITPSMGISIGYGFGRR